MGTPKLYALNPSTPSYRSVLQPTIHELISTTTNIWRPLQLPSTPDLGCTWGMAHLNESHKGMSHIYQILHSMPWVVPRCCPNSGALACCCWQVCEWSLCQQVSAAWNMEQRKHCEAPTYVHPPITYMMFFFLLDDLVPTSSSLLASTSAAIFGGASLDTPIKNATRLANREVMEELA